MIQVLRSQIDCGKNIVTRSFAHENHSDYRNLHSAGRHSLRANDDDIQQGERETDGHRVSGPRPDETASARGGLEDSQVRNSG